MKGFIKTFFAAFIANVVLLGLIFAFIAVVGMGMKAGKKPDIKKNSYLVIDIYGEILAYDPPESFPESLIGGHPETLHRILGNLEKAAVDDKIKGVIFKISSNNTLGMAMIEEIRGAIKKVRDNDKMVYAYSDGLDRSGLYLASACDSIFMPRISELVFMGAGNVRAYYRGTLDKLGIKPQIHKIKDYKSAAEMVLRKDMSPEAREMINWIMDDLTDIQLTALAQERELSRDKLIEHMEYALFLAHEARDAGLIDEVLYWDALKDRLKEEDDEKLKTVSMCDYAKILRKDVGLKGDDKIAVVHAQGMIGGRKNRIDPMFGILMGHETVAANLSAAGEDEDVKAVVFRVNSNGGEALTSDLIGHAIEELAAKKPVVVSMVNVAASGGYSISYRATKMLADASTITGSIGSISGKFVTTNFYNKLGITYDSVTKGPNAMMWSEHHEFTDKQWERFKDNHWDGFNMWLEDVAEHRGMTFEEAEKLAHGRVFTGRQAEENGLIDGVGGLDRAIELAKELAGIEAGEEVTLDHFPKKKGLLATITGGDGPVSALVRWTLYKFIHQDMKESLRLLSEAKMNTWDVEEH